MRQETYFLNFIKQKVLYFGLLFAMGFGLLIYHVPALAETNTTIPLLVSKTTNGDVTYNLSIKILLALALLTVLPALLITTTAFTRIMIVLSILRQALGIPNVPSNQIIIGLTLIMTVYVMMPMFDKINVQSLQPYIQNQLSEEKALETAVDVLKEFMFKQTRQADLNMFASLAKKNIHNNDYPFYLIMPAFITSELKTAFQIGFLIFLPFLIIDLVTASVLMSMGMMMLSPMIISLPFKILFFVMVNGWSLIVTSLVSSFR